MGAQVIYIVMRNLQYNAYFPILISGLFMWENGRGRHAGPKGLVKKLNQKSDLSGEHFGSTVMSNSLLKFPSLYPLPP